MNAGAWNTNNHKHDTDTPSDEKAPVFYPSIIHTRIMLVHFLLNCNIKIRHNARLSVGVVVHYVSGVPLASFHLPYFPYAYMSSLSSVRWYNCRVRWALE